MCLGCLDIRIEYSFLIQYAGFKVRMPQALAFGDGDGEIRTHDPLLARQVLSQLSYTPIGMRAFPFFKAIPLFSFSFLFPLA